MLTRIFVTVFGALAVMAAPLAILRWHRGKLTPPQTLAVLVRTTAILTLLLGSGHLLSVAGGLVVGRRPYDLHNVQLIWIGGILVFSAIANLLASRGLWRGESWAWGASGAATIFVWLFTLSLIPVTTGGAMDSSMNRALFVTHTVYLAYWATHRLKPPAAQAQAESKRTARQGGAVSL